MKLTNASAATALMIGMAFGSAPVASAEQEWDIGAYDQCMSKTVRNAEYCCVISGGVVGIVPGSCTAPAAAQIEEAPGRPAFTVPPDSNLPTLTNAPLQPIP